MPNYIHTASGTLASVFPWSITAKSVSSGTEAATETAWATGWANCWGLAAFKGEYATDVELTETSTSTATGTWHQSTITKTTHALAGTATQSLPYQTGVVVTLRTAFATKFGRGRWFLPPPAVGSLDAGGFVLSAAAQANLVLGLNAAWAAWAGSVNLVILHRTAPIGGAVGALTTTPITAADLANKFVVQKRRADKSAIVRATITL
jgi:hypothetical protein